MRLIMRTSSDPRRKFPASFLRSKPRLRRLLTIRSCTRNASAYRPSVASTSSRSLSLPPFARPRLRPRYNLMTLTIAVGYGGREEISDAVRSFLKTQAREGASLSDAIERITPETIACHLYASNLPDPDLIIRTSGEIRLSGFLLWQSVHSEFYFTDVLWPAFRKVDFLRAIRAYQARNRRFGR